MPASRCLFETGVLLAGVLLVSLSSVVFCSPVRAESGDRPFDRDEVLNALSNPDSRIRYKAVKKIEKAGRDGYQFLKEISSPSATDLTLAAEARQPLVKPGGTVELDVVLRNEGSSGAWVQYDNYRKQPAASLISYPDHQSTLYDQFTLQLTLPEPEGNMVGSISCGGLGTSSLRSCHSHISGLWKDLKEAVFLRPGDKISWSEQKRLHRSLEPFVTYSLTAKYHPEESETDRTQTVHLPEAWKQGNRSTPADMKPFEIQYCTQSAKDSTIVYTRPGERHTSKGNVRISFHPEHVRSDGRQARITGQVRLSNRLPKRHYYVPYFRNSEAAPFAYLLADRDMKRMVDAGPLHRAEASRRRHAVKLGSWEKRSILKNESLMSNVTHLPPGNTISREISFSAPLKPGLHRMFLTYGEIQVEYQNEQGEKKQLWSLGQKLNDVSLLDGNQFSRSIPIVVRPTEPVRSRWSRIFANHSLSELWDKLRNERGTNVRRVIRALVAREDTFVPFLRRKLEMLLNEPEPVNRKIKKNIRLLGHTTYSVRKRATERLRGMMEQYGPSVGKWFYRTLKSTRDPEVQTRIRLLTRNAGYPQIQHAEHPEYLALYRALDALMLTNHPSVNRISRKIHFTFRGTRIGRKAKFGLRPLH